MKAVFSLLLVPAAVVAIASQGLAAIQTKTVEYKHGDAVLEGYLAYDDELKGKNPGVLVVHEWTGLGPYVKRRVKQLAEMGYVAFGIDMYGKGIRPDNPKDAGAQATIYRADRPLMRSRTQAGLAILQQHPLTDRDRIAAIGYCFGGGTVLELARSGADIAGVVSFHGNLDTPDPSDAEAIQAKVLVLHGSEDPYVPPEQVAAFEAEMNNAEVDWQLISYGNTVHSFTNPDAGHEPSAGVAYSEKADRRSWKAMKQFFAELFALPKEDKSDK